MRIGSLVGDEQEEEEEEEENRGLLLSWVQSQTDDILKW